VGDASPRRAKIHAMLPGMSPRPTPIPLRPDRYALEREQRRSLVRAATAVALGAVQHCPAHEILARAWPHDRDAELVLRAAVVPTTTANATAISVDAVAFLVSMAPASAAARLFEKALRINLAGIHATNVARLLTVPGPGFVAEGAPIPVVAGDLDATPVGPTFKMALIIALSNELEFSSPENASQIIGRALSDAAMKQLDAVAFDSVAGGGSRPSGLLAGVTPLTATAGGGTNAMAGDLAALAGALSDAGVDAENMVIVANVRQATKLRLLAGPAFSYPILGTSAVASGTVVGIAPAGVASGFDGAPKIESSKDTTLHMDTAPVQIGAAGSPNVTAAPTRSMWQTDTLALRVRTNCAWSVVHPGAVAVVNSATW
jgi:Phage capsid family